MTILAESRKEGYERSTEFREERDALCAWILKGGDIDWRLGVEEIVFKQTPEFRDIALDCVRAFKKKRKRTPAARLSEGERLKAEADAMKPTLLGQPARVTVLPKPAKKEKLAERAKVTKQPQQAKKTKMVK